MSAEYSKFYSCERQKGFPPNGKIYSFNTFNNRNKTFHEMVFFFIKTGKIKIFVNGIQLILNPHSLLEYGV